MSQDRLLSGFVVLQLKASPTIDPCPRPPVVKLPSLSPFEFTHLVRFCKMDQLTFRFPFCFLWCPEWGHTLGH